VTCLEIQLNEATSFPVRISPYKGDEKYGFGFTLESMKLHLPKLLGEINKKSETYEYHIVDITGPSDCDCYVTYCGHEGAMNIDVRKKQ
jgi:hypothetical protein